MRRLPPIARAPVARSMARSSASRSGGIARGGAAGGGAKSVTSRLRRPSQAERVFHRPKGPDHEPDMLVERDAQLGGSLLDLVPAYATRECFVLELLLHRGDLEV